MAKIDKICPVVNLLTSQIWNKILFEYVSMYLIFRENKTDYIFSKFRRRVCTVWYSIITPLLCQHRNEIFFYCTSIAKYFAMVIKTIILHRVLCIFIYAND